jgi:hypothetical protein
MKAVDWNAPAALHQRDDSGSDMHYSFKTLRKGALGELVREVAAMASAERARVVIDVEGGKSLNVGEILGLAAREDLP